MSAQSGILLAVKGSLALTVFVLGLDATPRDATYMLRHPRLFARSIMAMNVLMPLTAVWVALVFALNPAVKIALVTLAVSPLPPLLPNKAMRSGGHKGYVISLLVTQSVLAFVVVPLTVTLLGESLAMPFHMPLATIAKLVGVGLLAPLALGMIARRVAPAAAARLAKPLGIIAMVALVGGILPILFTAWPAITSLIGNGTLLAIVALTLVGLGVGHVLGGPEREQRTVLALATASRHPGVAITIAWAIFPGDKRIAAAVLLALIVSAVVSVPYLVRSKQHARDRAVARPTANRDFVNAGARRR